MTIDSAVAGIFDILDNLKCSIPVLHFRIVC